MNVADFADRSKGWLLVGILALSSTASFGLGVLAGREQGRGAPEDDFWVEKLQESGNQAAAAGAAEPLPKPEPQPKPAQAPSTLTAAPAPAQAGSYVASKTGTKYYLPWCGTAKRIKEENKVWFATKAEAEAAGYAPASNCKGI
jgi:hypothetical protein